MSRQYIKAVYVLRTFVDKGLYKDSEFSSKDDLLSAIETAVSCGFTYQAFEKFVQLHAIDV